MAELNAETERLQRNALEEGFVPMLQKKIKNVSTASGGNE